MAAKIFFACFCRVLKRSPRTTKWKNESLKMRSTVFSFEKNEWNPAYITTIFQKSLESSRNDSVTNCCKEESRKTSNYFLFTLPLAILFSMLVSRTAYCGETDENIEQTPKARQKSLPFYCSRGVKAAKRKAKTEAARAELCKRRLFPSNENKENKTCTSVEPRIFRKNNHDSKNTGGEMVSIGKFTCISTLGSL